MHSHPHRFTARTKLIERMEARLRAQSWPRFQMALIVAFTGLAGLLASAVMLRLGLHSMALRYPLATVLAYAAFLGLLWLWMRTRAEDWSDAGDGVQIAADAADCISPALRSRGGGPDLIRRLAQLLERRGDFQEAAMVYRDLLSNPGAVSTQP